MTNLDKHLLAGALINAAANLVEVMHDGSGYHSDIEHIPAAEAAAQLASWLKNLPGSSWDDRLPLSPDFS